MKTTRGAVIKAGPAWPSFGQARCFAGVKPSPPDELDDVPEDDPDVGSPDEDEPEGSPVPLVEASLEALQAVAVEVTTRSAVKRG